MFRFGDLTPQLIETLDDEHNYIESIKLEATNAFKNKALDFTKIGRFRANIYEVPCHIELYVYAEAYESFCIELAVSFYPFLDYHHGQETNARADGPPGLFHLRNYKAWDLFKAYSQVKARCGHQLLHDYQSSPNYFSLAVEEQAISSATIHPEKNDETKRL